MIMRILYNSRSTQFKRPFGALHLNSSCEIEVHIPSDCNTVRSVLMIENEDGSQYKSVPMEQKEQCNEYDIYKCSFSIEKSGLYFYFFRITTPISEFSLFKHPYGDTNMEYGQKWQITCCQKPYKIADSFKGKVMYQIFPDRFNQVGECNLEDKITPYMIHQSRSVVPRYTADPDTNLWNNDFFGGNLKGIEEKLPYLKSFNVEIIYLNPIFMAFSNHRYDTADYKRIDPMLGTEQDFVSLCEKAHELGIKILLDGVFSHTGSDSVYFDINNRFGNGAYHHTDSTYYNWFEFIKYPNEYTSWWGINTLPCVRELNPDFVNFIISDEDSVLAHWIRLGADGFRLDVADELPDEFIKLLNDRVHEIKKESLVLGEVWEDASNKISYGVRRKYFSDNELDSVMNYPFKDGIINYINGVISALELSEIVLNIAENYPTEVLNCVMNSLSTHDTPRILTLLGTSSCPRIDSKDDRAAYRIPPSSAEMMLALRKYYLAVFIQYMLPGNPCIYYGDEIGMEGFEDPLNRAFFDWDRDDEVSASLLALYRRLGDVRVEHKAIQLGQINVNYSQLDEDCFSFTRLLDGEETVECICTVAEKGCVIGLAEGDRVIISNGCEVDSDSIKLSQYGFVALQRKAEKAG